jgi:hypothetical protein
MAKRNHHLEPAGIERIGHKPMPGKANLPTKVDDPRFMFGMVTGIPATLEISVPLLPAGELYVVHGGQSILNGESPQPGRIEGSIDVRSLEHRALGAWPAFLNSSPEITRIPKKAARCQALKILNSNYSPCFLSTPGPLPNALSCSWPSLSFISNSTFFSTSLNFWLQ